MNRQEVAPHGSWNSPITRELTPSAWQRLRRDGSCLAWLAWDHPDMPWDGTELWTGEFGAQGGISRKKQVSGGIDESIFQPEWSPDGTLHFVSDRTGWWNLYRLSK